LINFLEWVFQTFPGFEKKINAYKGNSWAVGNTMVFFKQDM
jgi:hypothetical protein